MDVAPLSSVLLLSPISPFSKFSITWVSSSLSSLFWGLVLWEECVSAVYPTLPWMVASLPYVLDTSRFYGQNLQCSRWQLLTLKTDDSIVSWLNQWALNLSISPLHLSYLAFQYFSQHLLWSHNSLSISITMHIVLSCNDLIRYLFRSGTLWSQDRVFLSIFLAHGFG